MQRTGTKCYFQLCPAALQALKDSTCEQPLHLQSEYMNDSRKPKAQRAVFGIILASGK